MPRTLVADVQKKEVTC